MKTADECTNFVHSKLLLARNFFNLVTGTRFRALFDVANGKERDILSILIQSEDYDGLKTYMEKIKTVETMSMRDLRKLAQDACVKHYNSLPKASLISELRNGTVRTNGVPFNPGENFQEKIVEVH